MSRDGGTGGELGHLLQITKVNMNDEVPDTVSNREARQYTAARRWIKLP